ncbi:hypothetical protein MA03_04085 [Infirmifilum uzonense]|uniref:Major facilitator superfamily (MFS) profile domain-containing protein n=1 Tax=Infirmifilum uzonense TaxID=1550241 RepID=A0A0F7FI74_9CREN|nr:MFS transporter [Infirmifilum uzonense]AKG38628.1 hypothetical protein MA03_04085 [Infirmifilum uzonense]
MPRDFGVAYVSSFVASFLQSVFIPTLVVYAYLSSLRELEISLITGFASLVYIPGALASAGLYSRIGARRIIVLAFGILAAGLAAHLFSHDFYSILLAASIVLLSLGVFWPALETYMSHSGTSVSLFSFSWSSGSLLGAFLTSTLLRFDARLLFASYALLSVIQALIALKLNEKVSVNESEVKHDNNIFSLLLLVTPWLYCLAYASSASGVFTFYPLFVERNGLSKDYISLVNFSMLLSRTITFFFYERIPVLVRDPLLASALFLVGGFLTKTQQPLLVVLTSMLIGYAQGVIYATALEQVFKRGQGVERATSLFESFIGLGYAIAPPISGLSHVLLHAEPISFSSMLSLLIALPGTIIYRRRKIKNASS